MVAAAVIGSAVVGAGASIVSGNKAASAQQSAADQATSLQQAQDAEARRQYDLNRADLAPYREAGTTALGQLSSGTAPGGQFDKSFTMADFNADPGYQFRLDEGNRAISASAAARGGVLSGGTLKALDKYSQGEASQEYGNAYDRYNNDLTTRFNRLSSLAGTGQTATNTGIAAGNSLTSDLQTGVDNITSNTNAAANARASQYSNTASAVSGAANSVGSYFALKNLYTPTPTASVYGISGSDGIY